MKLSLFALVAAFSGALALPSNDADCKPSAAESLHMGHGHDINTGTVYGVPLGLKLPGGSGCSGSGPKLAKSIRRI